MKLSGADLQVLSRIGGWNTDTLRRMGICKLYSCESGSVRAIVVGPRLGYHWKKTYYYRWTAVENEVGRFVPVLPERESDQKHLRACVGKVANWLDRPTA